MISFHKALRGFALITSTLILSGIAFAQDERPQMSEEGLQLVSSTDAGAFYVRPGVTLSEFKNAELLAAYVAVDETWVNNYNRQAMRSRRLREKDLEEIKTRVADDFWEVFGGEFFGARTYQEVQSEAASKLIMRPAIIDVSLASVNTTGDTLVQNLDSDSNGKMTLILEIYDASDTSLIGRLFNVQTVGDIPDFGLESSATNRADEREVYRTWASTVVAEMQAH